MPMPTPRYILSDAEAARPNETAHLPGPPVRPWVARNQNSGPGQVQRLVRPCPTATGPRNIKKIMPRRRPRKNISLNIFDAVMTTPRCILSDADAAMPNARVQLPGVKRRQPFQKD